MKLLVVKPFIVKPFVVDPNARYWGWFVAAWIAYLVAIGSFITSVVFSIAFGSSDAAVTILLTPPAAWIGNALVATGRFVRDTEKTQTETTKRLAEQDDRIHQLEAQVAALSTPSPKL